MPGLHCEWVGPAKRKVGGDALASPLALPQRRLSGPTKYGSKDGTYSPPPPPTSPPQSLDKEKWAFFGKMECHLSFRRNSAWLEIASGSHQCRLCSSWQKWKRHSRPDCLQEEDREGSPHQLLTFTWFLNVHKAMTKLKGMVLPVVMCGCECWTIKKAEPWKIDAFELWCWRRLLRVPWTARRTNLANLKELSP